MNYLSACLNIFLALFHNEHILCTMLKLPECHRYDGEFTVISPNKKLNYTYIEVKTFPTVLECLKRCLFQEECLTVNYQMTTGVCELLPVEHIPGYYVTHSLLSDSGWKHYQTKDKKKIGKKCEAGDFCPNARCRDKCESPFYECYGLLLDMSQGNPSQSSTYLPANGAEKAIEGLSRPEYVTDFQSHCSCASPAPENWWRIDFEYESMIHSVQVYRRPYFGDRLSNARINVLHSQGKTECGNLGDMIVVMDKTVVCQPEPIRGHGIEIMQWNNYLTLCEVLIYGEIIN